MCNAQEPQAVTGAQAVTEAQAVAGTQAVTEAQTYTMAQTVAGYSGNERTLFIYFKNAIKPTSSQFTILFTGYMVRPISQKNAFVKGTVVKDKFTQYMFRPMTLERTGLSLLCGRFDCYLKETIIEG